eukprot:9179830-Karenia_brevis.AAC.1
MKINVNTNIDGEIKRLNTLSDEDYDMVSGFFHNGAKSAAYRIITVDRIGNVPADMSPYTGFVPKCGYDCGKFDLSTKTAGRCEGHWMPSMVSSQGGSIPWAFVTSKILDDLDYVTG